ncbi:hypothetical protein ACA910_016013 [Epithemia clementina (nom. ined.)]
MNQPAFSSSREDTSISRDSGILSRAGSATLDAKGRTEYLGMSNRVSPVGSVGVRKLLDGVDKIGQYTSKTTLGGGGILSKTGSSMDRSDDGSDSVSKQTRSSKDDDTIDDEIARLEEQLRQLKQARIQSEAEATRAEDASEAGASISNHSCSTKTTDTPSSHIGDQETPTSSPYMERQKTFSPSSSGYNGRKWRSPTSKPANRITSSDVSDLRPSDFMGGGSWNKAPGFVPMVAEKRKPYYRKREDGDLSLASLVGGRDSSTPSKWSARRTRTTSIVPTASKPQESEVPSSVNTNVGSTAHGEPPAKEEKQEPKIEEANSDEVKSVEPKPETHKTADTVPKLQPEIAATKETDEPSRSDVLKADKRTDTTATSASATVPSIEKKKEGGNKVNEGSGKSGVDSDTDSDSDSGNDSKEAESKHSDVNELKLEEPSTRAALAGYVLGTGNKLTSSYMTFPTGKDGELVVTLREKDDDGEEERASAQAKMRQVSRGLRRNASSGLPLTRHASSGTGLVRVDSSKEGLTAHEKEPVRQIIRTKSSNLAASPLGKVRPTITRIPASAVSALAAATDPSSSPCRTAPESPQFPKYSRNRPGGVEAGPSPSRITSSSRKHGALRREDVSFRNRAGTDGKSVSSGDSGKKRTRKIKATKDDLKKLNQFLAQQEAERDDMGTVETNAAHIMDDGSTSSAIEPPINARPRSALRGGRRPSGNRASSESVADSTASPSQGESEVKEDENDDDEANKPSWALRKLRSTEKGALLKKAGVDLAKPISSPRMPVRYGD